MTMTSSVKPEQVLEAILAKGIRSDKAEKLHKLYALCSLEYGRRPGMRDLSPSNMSKIAESHGLFKARTIYNAQSKDYRMLIDAWYAYDGPNSSGVTKKMAEPAEKYDFLRKIDDPAVRSLCQLGFIERDKLRSELNMLRSKTEIIVDMRPLGTCITKGVENISIFEAVAQLNDSECKALISAINPKKLLERQWRLGKTGEVLDRHDRFVFLPGFATAITKILGTESSVDPDN